MIFKDELISSRNNPAVKYASSLKEKKYRDIEKAFFIEGEKLCFEAFESKLPIARVYISESKCKELLARIKGYSELYEYSECHVFVLSDLAFEKISTENSPQGIICILKHLDFFNYSDIIYKEDFLHCDQEKCIILCSVRDPGNLGAIIRSAVAFGVNRVFLTDDCADIYNARTVRGAMGSLFKIKITSVRDIASLIGAIRGCGRRVFAAELRDGASSLSEMTLIANDVFVIGNEGHGIPAEISSLCDGSIYIPISANTESLNASVATAVIMWEMGKLN